MLQGNLSTRPFYNERLVTLALVGVAVVVALLSVYNGTTLVRLSAEKQDLDARVSRDRAAAATVARHTATLEQTVNRTTLGGLADATREANNLIDQRTFSWTAFFSLIEKTLPIDARLVSVSPSVDRGVFHVSMIVVGRDFSDIESFIDALGQTGAFYDIQPADAQAKDDATYSATVVASYLPAGRKAPVPAAPVTKSADAPAAPPRAQ